MKLTLEGLGVFNVEDTGRRGGPVIAFVNPARTNLSVWEPILQSLERHYRIIRHDVRGTGASKAIDATGYRIEQFADDLLAILTALEVERVVVCGMAFGARVALQAALRHPANVAALVLFDATTGAPATLAEQQAGREEAKRLRALVGLRETTLLPQWFTQDDAVSAAHAFAAAALQADQAAALPALRVPTLLATGRQDPNHQMLGQMASSIAGSQVHSIEMCGHGSLAERPDAILHLLMDFMKGIET